MSAIAANAAAENLDQLEADEQKQYGNTITRFMTFADVKNIVRASENKLIM